MGTWNLDLGGVDPLLSVDRRPARAVEVDCSRFDAPTAPRAVLRRGVPVREVGGRLVTTVFDLLLAQYGVRTTGLPGQRGPPATTTPPSPTRRPGRRRSPASPAAAAARIAPRVRRSNAEESGGRSMIIMGAGTNHWFHSDTIYRGVPGPAILTGCQGVNGGGWAHYVGQEKVRPITGWSTLAIAPRTGCGRRGR